VIPHLSYTAAGTSWLSNSHFPILSLAKGATFTCFDGQFSISFLGHDFRLLICLQQLPSNNPLLGP